MGRENSRLYGKKTESDVGHLQLRLCDFLKEPFLVQAHLQHYTEPTAEPLPAASTLSGTILPLGPGTLTHNTAGVPIIVTCTKADLIDENNDIIGAGTSGMGGMVKGKGGEWEERTDGVMQVLRTICLKCTFFQLHFALAVCKEHSTRWCRTVLHHTITRHAAGPTSICPPSPLYASGTITWLHITHRRGRSYS